MAGILLFGNLRCSIALAREFAAAGHEVHCGVDALSPHLFASRAISGAFWHPDPVAEPDGTLTRIEDYLARHPGIDTLLPVSEIAMRLIVRNRGRLAPRARIAAVAPDLMETCIHKEAMFALCERIGVPVAARETVADHDGLMQAIARIGRPCIVKPVDSAAFVFGRKAVKIGPDDDPAALLPGWPDGHDTLCVQHFVEGARSIVTFAADHGRLLGAAHCRVLHTDRPDGTGYSTGVVTEAPCPALADATERLVRALDYTGAGDIDVIRNEATGEMSFLELNPRVGASYAGAQAAGLNVAGWMLDLAHGRTPQPLPGIWAARSGRRVVWTKGAVSGLLHNLRSRRVGRGQALKQAGRIAAQALGSRDMVFAWADPGPALWDYLHPLLRRTGVQNAMIEPDAGDRPGEAPAGLETSSPVQA